MHVIRTRNRCGPRPCPRRSFTSATGDVRQRKRRSCRRGSSSPQRRSQKRRGSNDLRRSSHLAPTKNSLRIYKVRLQKSEFRKERGRREHIYRESDDEREAAKRCEKSENTAAAEPSFPNAEAAPPRPTAASGATHGALNAAAAAAATTSVAAAAASAVAAVGAS